MTIFTKIVQVLHRLPRYLLSAASHSYEMLTMNLLFNKTFSATHSKYCHHPWNSSLEPACFANHILVEDVIHRLNTVSFWNARGVLDLKAVFQINLSVLIQEGFST